MGAERLRRRVGATGLRLHECPSRLHLRFSDQHYIFVLCSRQSLLPATQAITVTPLGYYAPTGISIAATGNFRRPTTVPALWFPEIPAPSPSHSTLAAMGPTMA